jgi:hypothetical protein
MTPPERYSASPLPSFCTVVREGRLPTLPESLTAVWRWLRKDRLTMRERQINDAVVNRLAEELGGDESVPDHPARNGAP